MKEKIKNLLSKKPVKIILTIINVLVYFWAILLTILLSIGLSISTLPNDSNNLDGHNVVKMSLNYNDYEQGTGYLTMWQQLASDEYYDMADSVFSNIYSEYSNYYADIIGAEEVYCNGLYINFPCYNTDWTYNDMLSLATTTYADNKVSKIVIYNRVYSLWGQNADYNYQYNLLRFDLINGGYVYFYIYHGVDSIYSIKVSTYNASNQNVNLDYSMLGLFCTNDFTFNNLFFIHSYWSLQNGSQENYNEGYRNGYTTGLDIGDNAGYNRGYDTGYDIGYDAGLVAGSTSQDLDMFTIIAHGFSAVADLMNISVFPGLTLGTLIFMPVIIITLIALFHLFKG